MTARVLVTGANGFIGRHLCQHLAERGYRVRAAVRSTSALAPATEIAVVGNLGARTEWSAALRDVDFVVHAAARTRGASDAESFLETNVQGTRSLATAAGVAGVGRLVLLSTVKVNGEENNLRALGPDDPPRPQDHYADSKLRAEQALTDICRGSGMPYAIVRAPLVYGPGVGGNFLRMMRWVDQEYPLPFGAVHNRRSLVGVWNLIDLVAQLLDGSWPDRIWMASDDEDLSTPELLRRLAGAMGRKPRLIAVPENLLRLAGHITGRRAEIQRLCGSLFVDVSRTRALLGWKPPVDVAVGLARTAAWFAGRN